MGGSRFFASEWEHFQGRAEGTLTTVLVVSAYDLNEYIVCDFRAEMAPLGRTIRDLWRTHADWPLCKRLLSQYPLAYVRVLFPTSGRSNGVMVGVREKFKELAGGVFALQAEAGPTLSMGGGELTKQYKTEKISDWDQGRMLRRLTEMKIACQGKQAFDGPKKKAFLRMLEKGSKQGHVIVVVLPVSPAYSREFLTPEVNRAFEQGLAEARSAVPEATWVRLDRIDKLHSNEYFWDLVHMNIYGRQIATEVFLTSLSGFPKQP